MDVEVNFRVCKICKRCISRLVITIELILCRWDLSRRRAKLGQVPTQAWSGRMEEYWSERDFVLFRLAELLEEEVENYDEPSEEFQSLLKSVTHAKV